MRFHLPILLSFIAAFSFGLAHPARAASKGGSKASCKNLFVSENPPPVFNSPALTPPINESLSALLAPGVFDKTRLILMRMKPTDISSRFISKLQKEFAPRLANNSRTVSVVKWNDIEDLYSRGPFGANAYSGADFSAPGAFAGPFGRVEGIQNKFDALGIPDILIIVLNPTKNVYEEDLLFMAVRRRHYSFRDTGVRKSTVVIGNDDLGGQLGRWSISYITMLEFIDAYPESSHEIINPNPGYNPIDIDTHVFPRWEDRWLGND